MNERIATMGVAKIPAQYLFNDGYNRKVFIRNRLTKHIIIYDNINLKINRLLLFSNTSVPVVLKLNKIPSMFDPNTANQ